MCVTLLIISLYMSILFIVVALLDFCFCFWLLFCVVLIESVYVAQASLKLMILLPQSSKCWDYRCAPPC